MLGWVLRKSLQGGGGGLRAARESLEGCPEEGGGAGCPDHTDSGSLLREGGVDLLHWRSGEQSYRSSFLFNEGNLGLPKRCLFKTGDTKWFP